MANSPQRRNLQTLAANLRLFFPQFASHFMCPLCLCVFHIERDQKQISKAHLIPKAAGGRHWTLLCAKCNNWLGSKQDKWFGERVRLYRGNKHVFQSRFKDDTFQIQGVSVNGHWVMSDEGDFEFRIDAKRNSPLVIEQLAHKFSIPPSKLTATITIPLADKDRVIRIGYLTMAYLYWFTFFGYSWVMQRHLDVVREQILHPERTVINEHCFTKFMDDGHSFDPPQFCAAMVSGIACASLLHQNVGVFFPTPSSPDAYGQLEEFSSQGVKSTSEIKFFNLKSFCLDSITAVIYENLLMVYPDAMPGLIHRGIPCSYVLFTEETLPEAKKLIPVSAEEAGRLRKAGEPVRRMRIRRTYYDTRPSLKGLLPP